MRRGNEGTTRSYVSASGSATVHRPPKADDLRALDRNYARDDFADTVAYAILASEWDG